MATMYDVSRTLGKAALDMKIIIVLADDEMHLAHLLQLRLEFTR